MNKHGGIVTKADIFKKVQETIGLSKKESAVMVEAVFSIMKSTLESGENLISGFKSNYYNNS